MLGAAVILFREVLEASLVIGIVMAATRGLLGRGRWVLGGIGGGVLGAMVVALFAGSIASAVAGRGQEIFNAAVLFSAVAMLGWHNVWMTRHGREITAHVAAKGRAVKAGEEPLYALAIVVGLATLREGAEVVLFLYGIALGSSSTAPQLAAGSLLGLAGGAALGFAIYWGLIHVPMRHLFTVTGWLILLLAAGMAAQGAGYLVRAGIVPALGKRIWDSAWLLPEDGILGQILHVLIGYDDRPSGIQIVAWLAALLIIGLAMRRVGRSETSSRSPAVSGK
jgi:high-affinity iron transporter